MARASSSAAVLVLVVATACTRSYTAGDSMVPTIAIGAEVALRTIDGEPRRGAVIVFRSSENHRLYVKRIIGLPGDTVAMNADEIVVNGKPITRCRVGPWSYVGPDGGHTGELWLERLDGAAWLVFHMTKSAGPAGPWNVAPGEVFVLGDNRENSHDSRVWFGGKGGGLPIPLIAGEGTTNAIPTLPRGAEPLASALENCLRSR